MVISLPWESKEKNSPIFPVVTGEVTDRIYWVMLEKQPEKSQELTDKVYFLFTLPITGSAHFNYSGFQASGGNREHQRASVITYMFSPGVVLREDRLQ